MRRAKIFLSLIFVLYLLQLHISIRVTSSLPVCSSLNTEYIIRELYRAVA